MDLRGCGDSDTPSLRTQYTIDIITEDIVHLIGSLGAYAAVSGNAQTGNSPRNIVFRFANEILRERKYFFRLITKKILNIVYKC